MFVAGMPIRAALITDFMFDLPRSLLISPSGKKTWSMPAIKNPRISQEAISSIREYSFSIY